LIRVTVWNEYVHELEDPAVRAIYPEGIHGCIGDFLSKETDMAVRLSVMADEGQGLSDRILDETDVLVIWAHMRHEGLLDETAARVRERVLGGMGLIALHSAHHSKILKALLGTSLNLSWRHCDRERLWCVNPGHPIAQGLPEHFELESEEMYGEPFDIPQPDELVFLGWFAGGEVFRSGCTFTRGRGKIFYFQPGHEEYPTYRVPEVRRVIANAVRWAYRENRLPAPPECRNPKPLEWGAASASKSLSKSPPA
jgi:trehalose utilization protein